MITAWDEVEPRLEHLGIILVPLHMFLGSKTNLHKQNPFHFTQPPMHPLSLGITLSIFLTSAPLYPVTCFQPSFQCIKGICYEKIHWNKETTSNGCWSHWIAKLTKENMEVRGRSGAGQRCRDEGRSWGWIVWNSHRIKMFIFEKFLGCRLFIQKLYFWVFTNTRCYGK